MATLFDLAQQYLNRALPETFKYDRTNPPTIGPVIPVQPEEPIAKILPVQGGGGDGYGVYNPDPNRTRTSDQYSPYNYRQAAERSLIGSGDSQFDINKYGTGFRSETEAQKFMDNYPEYYQGPQLTGIPGAIAAYAKNSLPGRIIGGVTSFVEDKLPVNQRAILENELLGQGFQLNDIGQFVSDGGDAYKEDGSNIMAGYNAAKVTRQTFDKRRAKAKENMTPEGFEKFNKALTAAEDKFFGGSAKATTVFNDKLKQKDIDDGFINDQIPTYDEEIKTSTYLENDEDNILDDILDYTNRNIYNTDSIYTSVPKSTYDEAGLQLGGDGTGSVGSYDDSFMNEQIDRDIINRGGGDNLTGGGLNNSNREDIIDRGSSGDPNSGPITQTTKPGELKTSTYDSEGEDDADVGKIVCTMMNEFYGFGSFRNKIWLKHSKGLAPEYQKGYHKLFLPLVRIAKTNKVVRKILEHIAVHRTIDIRQESRGKVHLLGRVYRKILEPLCYFVGKHG
jgi:hypothetical protein